MPGPGTPIQNVFNEPEIEAQVKRVLAQLSTVADSMADIQKMIESTKGIQSMANLSKAIDALGAASNSAQQASLKLKTEEEQLSVVISKVAASTDESNKKMSETEKLTKLYEQTLKKLNATLSTEAELAAQAKVALAETNKQLKDQAKQALGLVGAYDLLQAEFKDLSTKAKDMATIWGVNSAQAKEAAAAAIEVNNKLKLIDGSVGNFQRNVGNYASGFQNFNQVLREMPNFAISATTGIQSLSNNVPMLRDEIARARAAGMSWGEVIKTLGSSLFGWGGAIVAVTVLLTGLPKILKAVASESENYAAGLKSFKEVQAEATKNTVKDKIELEALLVVARDVNLTQEKRSAAVKKINDIMPDYLGNLTLENINTKAASDAITGYISQLSKKALAQAYIAKIQDLYTQSLIVENEATGENIKWYQQLFAVIKNSGNAAQLAIDLVTTDTQERIKKIKAINDERDALEKKFKLDLQNGKAELDLNKTLTEEKVKNQKEVSDKTLEYALKSLKAQFEIEKAKLEAAMATSKSIMDDDELSYDTRYAASQKFYADQQRLIKLQRDFELSEIDLKNKEIDKKERKIRADKKMTPANKKISLDNLAAERKANADQALAVDAEYQKKAVSAELAFVSQIEKINEFLVKKLADLDKKAQEDKLKGREEANNALIANVNEASVDSELELTQQLTRLNEDFLAGKFRNVEAYERKKAEIELKYAKQSVLAQIAATEVLLSEGVFAAKEEAKWVQKLADLKLKLSKLVLDTTKADVKEQKRSLLEMLRDIQTAVANISSTISTLASIGFENRQAELETERTQIEKNSAAELKKIQDSTASQQDQAAQIIKLEAVKQSQLEENDRKRRKLDTERARFERLNSIANIITGTSLAVVGALKNPGGFAGLALSFTFGALGLAQLTKALSSPVPKYKHGTDWHKGGMAIVGDGGKQERVYLPSGEQFDTPSVPTLINLPRGSKVLPDASKVNRAMFSGMYRRDGRSVSDVSNKELVNWQTKALLKGMAKNKPVINNKTNVNIGRDFYLFNQVFK